MTVSTHVKNAQGIRADLVARGEALVADTDRPADDRLREVLDLWNGGQGRLEAERRAYRAERAELVSQAEAETLAAPEGVNASHVEVARARVSSTVQRVVYAGDVARRMLGLLAEAGDDEALRRAVLVEADRRGAREVVDVALKGDTVRRKAYDALVEARTAPDGAAEAFELPPRPKL